MSDEVMAGEFPDEDQRLAVCNQIWRDRDKAFDNDALDVPFEIKSLGTEVKEDGAEVGTFSGLASTFGNTDLMGDVIAPGAFKSSIRSPSKIRMFWQHDPGEPIGMWRDMRETDRGLEVRGELFLDDDIPTARKAYALLKRKGIDSMSIGFRVPNNGWEFDKENQTRILTKIDLMEISLVSIPANPKARVQRVKNVDWQQPDPREIERFLREAGAPKDFAKLFVTSGLREVQNRLSVRCEADGRHVDEVIAGLKRRGEALKQLSKGATPNGKLRGSQAPAR